MQLSFNLSLLCFFVYLGTILCALRIVKKISPTVIVCGNAVFIYVFGLILINSIKLDGQVYFFHFSVLYWFLSLSLLMIFGAIYKSISLRMMLHLLGCSGKTDSYHSILENYIKDQSYINRVEILIEKGMIERLEANFFQLTHNGKYFAKALWSVQKIFSIKESG